MTKTKDAIELMIASDGNIRMIYSEELDAFALGQCDIQRASHVEPDEDGYWHADLSLLDGPTLGPCLRRRDALALEDEWLRLHWLDIQPGID